MLENGKLLIKLEKAEDKTASGIIISNSQKTTNRAVVVKVAKLFLHQSGEKHPTGLNSGDVIFLDPRTRMTAYNEDQSLYIIDLNDVLLKEE